MHIPHGLIAHFIQPILQVLSDPQPPDFFNLSITPVEVSVICPCDIVDRYFVPINARLVREPDGGDNVEISNERYMALQVDSEGTDSGARLLSITVPLALAGV